MLRIALETSNKNFDTIIEEAIPLWKNETKYQFLYANPSLYMSTTSGASCSITSVMSPNFEDVDYVQILHVD